ncbi:MAG: hypothetical protein VR65_03650 [Desulfobulbaceae bacterium BRH_c16a]|nr:MAG: hypothetical protein VR65_03650 [Desulfobulbaceae bacterium BRH_c16a]
MKICKSFAYFQDHVLGKAVIFLQCSRNCEKLLGKSVHNKKSCAIILRNCVICMHLLWGALSGAGLPDTGQRLNMV